MHLTSTSLMVGIAAGIAAVLLSIGLVVQSGLSFLLYGLSPLPIMLAGLGWGPVAGAVSVLSFGAVLYFAAGDIAALISVLVMALPAAIGVYFIGMARTSVNGQPEWFPLGNAIFFMAVAVAFGSVISGFLVGYGPAFTQALSVELVKQIAAASAEFAADPLATIELANLVIKSIPLVHPATWVAVLVANFWLALKIAQRSGLFTRIIDDWPSSLRIPSAALPLFALAMAGTFLEGEARTVVYVFAGSFGMAFMLSGFALFHHVTRGKPWRLAALWLGWLSLITVGLTAFVFLFAGVYASAKKSTTA